MRSFYHVLIEIEHPNHVLPRDCDAPPRNAAEDAILKLHPEIKIIENASGWGGNRKGHDAMLEVSCKSIHTISLEDSKRSKCRRGGRYKRSSRRTD